MKTKDLIKLLQDADPTGEAECCIHGCDIIAAENLPAYYDGRLETITTKEDGTHIAKWHTQGRKVLLRYRSINDLIWDYAEQQGTLNGIKIDYSDLNEIDKKNFDISIAITLRNAVDMQTRSEMGLFYRWALPKALAIFNEIKGLQEDSDLFFTKNLSPYDPIPTDLSLPVKDSHGSSYVRSYNDRRCLQWDREISIEWDGLSWVFKRSK